MDREPLYRLIRRFEGFRARAYFCPAGILTCGYGSTGPDITPATAWSREQAELRMQTDAERAIRATQGLCPELQGDALLAIADFVYNLGAGRLKTSTLRKALNAGDFERAERELRKWVYGGGKKLPGLLIRREAEIALMRRGL